jgi:hypothetical protein
MNADAARSNAIWALWIIHTVHPVLDVAGKTVNALSLLLGERSVRLRKKRRKKRLRTALPRGKASSSSNQFQLIRLSLVKRRIIRWQYCNDMKSTLAMIR